MTDSGRPRAAGFHDGELAVQRRVGVEAAAARLAGMLDPPDLHRAAGRFPVDRTFAALTARDHAGRLWTSPMAGPPGFLHAEAATILRIHTAPAAGDPLHRLAAGQPAGLLCVDFASRRRVRVNGTLRATSGSHLELDVDQAYGNCPQYIQQRILEPVTGAEAAAASGAPSPSSALAPVQINLIRRADTFVLGTTHPEHGNDTSHRGGPPGFVRIEADGSLWWPDYPGNNMFNSLGNLTIDPTAALLFAEFATGTTVQLSGTAAIEWTPAGTAGDDAGTGRRVRFTAEAVVAGRSLPLRAEQVYAYPYNPPLADGQPVHP